MQWFRFIPIFLLILTPVFSKESIEKIYTNAEAHNLLFPLDGDEIHYLLVEVPDYFKYAFYEGSEKKITLQYIPKSEKLKKWSEIITVWIIPPTDDFESVVEGVIATLSLQNDPHIHFQSKEWARTVSLHYETPDSRGKEKSFEAYHGKGYQGEQAYYIIHYGFRYGGESSIKEMSRLKKKASTFIGGMKIVKP